jgi:ribose/xylose/arabinose/galactoside ABC-type transport system permease subunit
LPLLLVAELALFTWAGGVRLNSPGEAWGYVREYFADLFAQSAPIMVLAVGMTIVIATAGIDLSVGSMVALVACAMSLWPPGPDFWYTAVPLGLALAIALGGANGMLVGWLDVPPIVATLGSMILYRGLCFVLLGEQENAPFLDVPGLSFFGELAGSAVVVGAVLLGCMYYGRSRWRREILLVGGNRAAARYAAVPVDRRLIEVYTLLGLLAFLAGLCLAAREGAVKASSWTGLELQVIVAVVLGGTPVSGGRSSVAGSLLGVLLVAVLDEGLRSASSWGWQNLPFQISHLRLVLLGVLLVLGVWLGKGRQE